ncbi:MAG: apolipoprotein N-acyltransferase [Bradymonadales bacterium]|nr:MAG: apolipoprotein N-acyltransferase [Bradymonadales bacterium]
MILWICLQSLAGLLMSLAHPVRFGSFVWEPGVLNFLLASLGLALFIKVSSMRRKKLTRFFLGFWGGFVFFGASLYWLVHALLVYGEIHLLVSIFVSAGLWAYCALFLGLWALIAGMSQVLQLGVIHRSLLWASLWAALGVTREYLFTGFGWGELGYFFAEWPLIGMSASIWGVHGLSFLWIFFVSIILHFDAWLPDRRARLAIGGLSLLFVGLVLFSYFKDDTKEYSESIRVSLVQPNIPQEVKWNPAAAAENLRQLMRLTTEALEAEPDLIVWPETSYPFALGLSQRQLPFSSPKPLLFGGVVSDRGVIRNSAILAIRDQVIHRYDKVHLVPFGEYVPFEDILPFEKLVANVGRFLPGEIDQDLVLLDDLRLGILICYEDIFVRHAVRHSRSGAQILVNLTNDAWYGESSALRQHENIARLHAWTVGLPMIRSTNNGQTSVLSGRSRHAIPLFEEGVLTEVVAFPTDPQLSFFARTYPMMQWIWFAVFAIGFLWRIRSKNRKIFFPESNNSARD